MPGSSPVSGWPIPLDSDPLGDAAGEIIRDLVDGIEAGWVAYTPAWVGTVNPTLGNGTLAGRYKRIGKTVLYRIRLTIGSTTTIGSGAYRFSLPTAQNADYGTWTPIGTAWLFDTSAPSNLMRHVVGHDTLGCFLTDDAGTQVAHNAPFTWANGDQLRIAGVYEST